MKKFFNIFKDYDVLLLTICTAIVFLSNLIALEGFGLHEIIGNRYLVVLLLYILIMVMLKKRKAEEIENSLQKKNIFFIVIWSLFLISILISKIINKGSNIIDILLMLSIVPIFFFKKNSYNIDKHLNIACIINLIPLLFIMKGGNTLSLLITIIGITTINITIRKIRENGYIIAYTVIIAFFVMLIAITKCRTCMISFLIISGINYIYILTKNNFYKKKIIVSAVLIICLILSSNSLISFLFNKYNSYGDITTGRGRIWENVINDGTSLFGHNDNYFMEIANKGDAHNVYIQIFGHYGIISLCLYVVLNIYILIMIFRKRRKIEYINFFLNYFIVSMFENILLTDTKIVIYNILFLVYVGKLLRDDTGTLKNENEDYLNIIKNIYNKIKDFIITDKKDIEEREKITK